MFVYFIVKETPVLRCYFHAEDFAITPNYNNNNFITYNAPCEAALY